MNTTLKKYAVREIVDGFVYNELEGKGLFGLSGKLTIQPEYQRNYIYADGKKNVAVIDSLLKLDSNITELKTYFASVIDWVSGVFRDVESEMRGLEWGRLYEEYHARAYDPTTVSEAVHRLYGDVYVKNRRGVFEYILGGEIDTKLLDVRVFDDATKKVVYIKQTDKAKTDGVSNCSLCAVGHDANKSKLWEQKDMDADHVAAWSRGGATDIANCEMLCKSHNRAKENR
jgi:5-methylcytosine-specific restriction endonuclease McrA